MSQSTQRAHNANKRLVLCVCTKCRAAPQPNSQGQMIELFKRRHHIDQDILNSGAPALVNRGKHAPRGVAIWSHGRGGLPAGSQVALPFPQAGPSGLSHTSHVGGEEARVGTRLAEGNALSNMEVDSEPLNDPQMDPRAPELFMSQYEPTLDDFDPLWIFQGSLPSSQELPLFDSELDEVGPEISENDFLGNDDFAADVDNNPEPSDSSSDSSSSSSKSSSEHDASNGEPHPDATSHSNLPPPSRPARPPRFVPPSRQATACEVFANSHDKWFIRWILLVVAFLHTKHHLSFRASGILLWVLHTIFILLGLITTKDPMPTTLSTTFKHLGFTDNFAIIVVCPECRIMCGSVLAMPQDEDEATCHECNASLYNGIPLRYFTNSIHTRAPLKKGPTPKMVIPYNFLKEALADLLTRPGMEDEIEAWRTLPEPPPGVLRGNWDGKIWKTLRGHDGKLFFATQEDNELRIGLSGNFDGFQGRHGELSPSHSSGVLSYTVANLLAALKYQPGNLLVNTLTAGPNEATAEELQLQLDLSVDELEELFVDGIKVPTPRFPEGRRVRVALVAIVCDHPAAVKMCGCADKLHNVAPCTQCTVTQEDFFSDESLRNEFPKRDGKKHREMAYQYHILKTPQEHEDFFKAHGVRWFAFARLSYFDAICMTIIDPMHNLLMGVLKNHWYNTWILGKTLRSNTATTKRELDLIHEHLANFEMPPYVARPAKHVGEPSGGGLPADTYKGLGTVFLPAIAPLVWDASLDSATSEYNTRMCSYNQQLQKWEKKHGADFRVEREAEIEATQTQAEKIPAALQTAGPAAKSGRKKKKTPPPPQLPEAPRMREGKDEIFLKLATATKIFTQYEIATEEIERAGDLMTEYLLAYKAMYGESMLKPNHHYVVHLREQIYDYSPVYGFWCFLGERLNKLLKSFKSNNWSGGQLEVSMMCEWGRSLHMRETLDAIAASENPRDAKLGKFLQEEPTEARGTVEAIAAAHHDALSDIK